MKARWAWLLLFGLLLACGGGSEPAPPVAKPTFARLEVRGSGVVRVSYEELRDLGLGGGTIPVASLRLTCQGKPVALKVEAHGKATLGPGDIVEFFAPGLETPYTDTTVYWLGPGTEPALTWGRRTVTGGTAQNPVTIFRDRLWVEQNKRAWGLAPGMPEQDYFFWEKLTAPVASTYAFEMPPVAPSAGPAQLTVKLLGGSSESPTPDHHVQVSLDGVPLGEAAWDGFDAHAALFEVPGDALQAGSHTLGLSLPGATGAVDVVWFDGVEVRFDSSLEARSGRLAFSATPDAVRPFRVKGFDGLELRLLDITDPAQPVEVEGGLVETVSGLSSLRFLETATGARAYVVAPRARVLNPLRMSLVTPGRLREPSLGADYLLIAPRAFMAAAQPLLQLRRSQGLRAEAVAVEELYDEFGTGMPDPQAIKDFLRFAVRSWRAPAPTMVLLLGDATYDYRDFLGTGKRSQVPAHLANTALIGLTPDDNWYADLEGDAVPELSLGRLPAANVMQVADLVQKLIRYESALEPASRKALLVADNNDPSFQEACERYAALLPSATGMSKVYLSQYTDFSRASVDVLAGFNGGVDLALYAGHGNVTDWAGEKVFDLTAIPALANGSRLPFVVALNCLNGWFSLPTGYCLAEALVREPDRGAIAMFASSGLGYQWEQDLLAQALLQQLATTSRPRLGELCRNAKAQAYRAGASGDLLITYTLIGDPATRLAWKP